MRRVTDSDEIAMGLRNNSLCTSGWLGSKIGNPEESDKLKLPGWMSILGLHRLSKHFN